MSERIVSHVRANRSITTPIMKREYARPIVGRDTWTLDALVAASVVALVVASTVL